MASTAKSLDVQALTGRIEHIFISPGHNLFGNKGVVPHGHPLQEVASVSCVAGSGLEGDRFFDYKADYSGQVTFFAMEVYEELCRATGIFERRPGDLRRNVFVRGIDLNALIKRAFSVQGIVFTGSMECSPCHWMDQTFGPGAEAFLKNRGGLRARILTSGNLVVGPC